MATTTVLTIDIGTTRMKHACIERNGAVLHYQTLPIRYAPDPGESNIEQWFDELIESIRAIPEHIRRTVRAVAVSGQGPSLIPLNVHGAALRPLLFHPLTVDEKQHSYSHYLPFAIQYLRRRPVLAEQIRQWIPIPEYIIYRLCGRAVVMLPTPQYRPYYWTARTLRRAGLVPAHFPPIVYTGSIIAPLTAALAARSGLSPQVALIAGGLDFCAAIIGARCLKRGAICDRAGSTQGLNFIGHSRSHHPLLQSYPLWHRRLGNQSLLLVNSGLLLADTTPHELAALRRFVSSRRLSVPPLLPTLRNRGVVEIVARRQVATERLRALEAVLFTMRYVVELFPATQRGETSIALCGGQAQVPQWNALKADLLGVACQRFQCLHTELLGAAAIAYRTLGIYRDWQSATAHITHVQQHIRPRSQRANLPRYDAFSRQLTQAISDRHR